MPLENCPKCDRKLGSPLKSSGRQVCAKCGWSDEPRQKAAANAEELSADEIKKLLRQAEAQALENMKPKKQKQGPQNPLSQNPLGIDPKSLL